MPVRPPFTGYLPQSSSASRLTAGASGFLLLSQCGEQTDRRPGTFSVLLGYRALPVADPIRPTGETWRFRLFHRRFALAREPLLTFTCPKTKERTPTRVEADARTLRASWKSRLLVKCPSCGGVHEISVRDAYLNGAIDVVRQPVPRRGRVMP
jgi:hypothetical protein